MFGKKNLEEGDYVFATQPDGEYTKVIVGIVTGVEDSKIGVNGIIIKQGWNERKQDKNNPGKIFSKNYLQITEWFGGDYFDGTGFFFFAETAHGNG